jgi:uncharacterized MAPEG superfamily protein
MTVPIWMLLGFAAWTVCLLLFTVGIYRWSRILTGRVPIRDFLADKVEGEEWYRRAMRAHANCVENLPVFGVIVFALFVSNVGGATANYLSIGILASRVIQSLIHVPTHNMQLKSFGYRLTRTWRPVTQIAPAIQALVKPRRLTRWYV